jgi:hypothetical protein
MSLCLKIFRSLSLLTFGGRSQTGIPKDIIISADSLFYFVTADGLFYIAQA